MGRTKITIAFALALLVCAPVFSQEDCGLRIDITFEPASIVLGSKVNMSVSLLNSSTESIIVPIDKQVPSFLEVYFGEGSWAKMLRKPSGGLQTQELEANERVTVKIGAVYGPFFCEPGTYTVSARLSDDVVDVLGDVSQCAQGVATIVVTEPTGEDKRAFDAVVEAFNASRFTCVEATVYARFQSDLNLVDEFPTALYSGFALAEQLPILPGLGENPAEKVQLLSDPGFFARFPTTHDRSDKRGDGERLDMRTEVEAAANVRRDFLQAHPDFVARSKIERQLGELELVLGNHDRAYSAWKWIVTHSASDSTWAAGMAEAMESQGLVSSPDAID